MTPAEMLRDVKRELSRPDTDRRIADADIFGELREAERTIKRELGMREQTRRIVLEHPCVVPPDTDEGITYTIPPLSIQAGTPAVEVARYDRLPIYIRVWTPPGLGTGDELRPAYRGIGRQGYILRGNVLHMEVPRTYTPGLYVEGVFDFGAVAGPTEDDPAAAAVPSSLIDVLHKPQVYYAAYAIADRPGMRMQADRLERKAQKKLAEVVRSQTFTVERPDLETDPGYVPWYKSIRTS